MKKEEMYSELRKILEKMMPHLKKSGVQENRLTLPDREIEGIKVKELQPAYNWIKRFYNEEFERYMETYILHTPQTWEHFEFMEIDDLAEILTLEKKRNIIRKKWYNERPEFWRKHKKRKVKNG